MTRIAALAVVFLLAFGAVACDQTSSSSGGLPTSTASISIAANGDATGTSVAVETLIAGVALYPGPRVTLTAGDPPAKHTCAPPYPSGPPSTTTVFCADPSKMEDARVLRIVDGDTIHVELNGQDETIRFYGIDTTERGEACFSEATERTRELVGSEVRLLPDARNRDKYGRLLRYVYTPQGLSVDAEMVDEGLAHAWRSDGALRFAIIALEDAAHSRHEGCLWR